MGQGAEKLKHLLSEGDNDGPLVQALGLAEDVYGTLSGAYATYGAVTAALGAIGILGSDSAQLDKLNTLIDSILDTLVDVLASLDELKALTLADHTLMKLTLLTSPLASVKVAFNHALAAPPAPDDSMAYAVFLDSIDDSWTAITQLALPSMDYWYRLFAREALYSDAWTGYLQPDTSSSADGLAEYVWDYRVLLPRYLDVLAQHTCVYLKASELDPAYGRLMENDMQALGLFLYTHVFQKITSAVAHIRPPSRQELKYVLAALDDEHFFYYRKQGPGETFTAWDFLDPTDGTPIKIVHFATEYPSLSAVQLLLTEHIPGGLWRFAGFPFGAVEAFSGFDSTFSYPLAELEAAAAGYIEVTPGTWDHSVSLEVWTSAWDVQIIRPTDFQRFHERFVFRHAIRTLRQHKELYRQLGLPRLCAIIVHQLRTLHSPLPKALLDADARLTSWSLREVYGLLPSSIDGAIVAPGGDFTLRWLLRMSLPPADLPPPLVSLRKCLLLDEERVAVAAIP